MGDQLAKGWADRNAKPQDSTNLSIHNRFMEMYIEGQQRAAMRIIETEIQAEEDMLP